MNEKSHRRKSFLSVTLPYRCNSYVRQVSQKEKFFVCDTWLTQKITKKSHRNKTFCSVTLLVHRHFLYIKTNYASLFPTQICNVFLRGSCNLYYLPNNNNNDNQQGKVMYVCGKGGHTQQPASNAVQVIKNAITISRWHTRWKIQQSDTAGRC